MTTSVKVSSQYQMSIPAVVIKKLKIKPGMRVSFTQDPKNPSVFIIENTEQKIEELKGILNKDIKKSAPQMLGISDEDLEKEIYKSKINSFK